MTVPFNTIPTSLRQPFFFVEMDASQAGYFSQNKRSLLIGQKATAGTAAANTPVQVTDAKAANALFGQGSMLARMVAIYRQADPVGELWAIAVPDAAGGVAATSTVTVTGPASAAGTINLYIAGINVQVAVASGDSANSIATAIGAAVNANLEVPTTATVATNVVTLTVEWKGATGNDVVVVDSFRGQAGGESLPAGVGLAYAAGTAGATNPTLTSAIAAMGDDPYDYVIHPYTDSASLDAFKTELGDSAGRWSYLRQIFGHAYSAARGSGGGAGASGLLTLGGARNDQHHTIWGFEADIPNPCWECAAAYGARNAVFLNANVSRPTQTGVLSGILAPRPGKRFVYTELNSLLYKGIATSYTVAGSVLIGRAVTTYQLNATGQADPSYLDSEVMHQNAEFIRRMRNIITTKYPRHSLANDGTRFGTGAAIVTPKVVAGEIDAEYRRMEEDGLVENFAAWQANRIVERDANNPNRLNVLLAPDFVNQLRIVGALNQFRLQYPATA